MGKKGTAFRFTSFKYNIYCGIIRIDCGSIFVVFWGNPSVQIYIIEETNLKSIIFVTGTENRHTHEITPLSKHKALNPQKLATRNLNDSKVIQFGNYFFKSWIQIYFMNMFTFVCVKVALGSENWLLLFVNSLQKTFDSQICH